MDKEAYYLPVFAHVNDEGQKRVGFKRVLKENLTEAQKVFIEETKDMDRGLLRAGGELSRTWIVAAEKMWAAE